MMILSTLLSTVCRSAYLACFGTRSTGLILDLRPCLRRDGTTSIVLWHIVLCEIIVSNWLIWLILFCDSVSVDECILFSRLLRTQTTMS
jgi:hypothetical protein